MKKLVASLMMGIAAFALVACGNTSNTAENEESNKVVKVQSLNGNKEEVEVEVPYDPQRIAILDLAALDIIDSLGMGDRVVGTADTSIEYLQSYVNDKEVVNLGSIKEADMEKVMESEPDVIFIGGRLAASYDELSKIAPVVYLSTDVELGLVKSVEKNTTTIASMFGLEEEVAEKMSAFDKRIAALQEVGKEKETLVGMVTSGSFNLLGNNGRCSLIGNELGFNNLTADTEESGERGGRPAETASTHGNESSFEVVVAKNPEYIFVLDRDSAIGTEGAQLAQDVMNNELINGTDAYKNGKIVYLEHPSIWYTAEGGLRALDLMLQDLEGVLLK